MSFAKPFLGTNFPNTLGTTSSQFSKNPKFKPLSSQFLGPKSGEDPRCYPPRIKKTHSSRSGSLPLEKREEIKSRLSNALLQVLNLQNLAHLDPEEAREEILFALSPCLQEVTLSWTLAEQKEIIEEICDTLLGYGPLEPLLQQEEISRILVNGPSTTFIEVAGKIKRSAVYFANSQELLHVCRRLLCHVGLASKTLNRFSDERFPDGTRVNIVLPPLSLEGPALTLHRANQVRFGFEQLVGIGAISQQARSLLETLRCARTNILISGGRSSGRTTLVNCLLEGISSEHRVIVCGEAVGCDMRRPNIVHLEPRPQNFEGEGQVTLQDLVKNSLRLGPHHLVVDELRGREALDLLHGLSAGQEGAIATILAYSPQEALRRIEEMILTTGWIPARLLRQQVAKLFPIVVQTCQFEDGSRKVISIDEVRGVVKDKFNFKPLFSFDAKGRDHKGRIVGEWCADAPPLC